MTLHGLGHDSIHRHDLTPISTDKLHVIAVISNTRRFKSRYNLYRKFAKHVADSGGQLWTVEVAYGERPFEITMEDGAKHIQLRTAHELWHKENMINVAMARLPSDWKYVAWVDADIQFARPDWVQETIHMLQHHKLVQMWSMAHDLDPNADTFRTYRSFAYCYQHSIMPPFDGIAITESMNDIIKYQEGGYYGGKKPYWHSGYAWAARREAIDALGGLVDFCIIGAADHHMAHALIGEVDRTMPKEIGGSYRSQLHEWQARAEKYIRRDIGYVSGSIIHYWHGNKKSRRYMDRWKLLARNDFEPSLDLKRDSQGLWQLTDRSFRLRDDLRHYMQLRNEDDISFTE